MLHNISVLCPIISTYISNYYNTTARLFIIGQTEILSKEGTTQGDPTVMAAYALGLTHLIQHLREITSSSKLYSKEITYADDFIVAGSVKDIKYYWQHLNSFAPFFGYYPNASESQLIVKSQYLETANVVFGNTKVNLTSEGTRHLGAPIGNHINKEKHVSELVTSLNDQLQLLSKIAETKPQAAYAAFGSGFKSKLTYFICTIPDISELLLPLEHITRQKLIPAITGGQICSDNERILLSLPKRYGGLNIPIFQETAKSEYENCRIITRQLTNLIINQDPIYTVNSSEVSKLKNKKKQKNRNEIRTF